MRELQTFPKEREVSFNDFAVETKNSFEVSFDDVASQICDDNDFCVWLVDYRMFIDWRVLVDVHVGDIGWRRRR